MKKCLAALLAWMLAVLPLLAGAETVLPQEEPLALTVGSAEAPTGAFFTGSLGGSEADRAVRSLLHGYSLAAWRGALNGYDINEQVVNGFAVTERQNGDRVYHIALHRDLKYCDGTPITAKDYAFSLLLSASRETEFLGGRSEDTAFIAGAEAYRAGEAPALSGVRLLNDYQINVTVKAEYLPFFYELSFLDIKPYPIQVLAPGCEVKDDGAGVYIKGYSFTARRLKKTILDAEVGYQSHPMVTSGPYRLVEYRNGTAEFEKNPYYKGDQDGRKPIFQSITLLEAAEEDLIAMLAEGRIGLATGCRNKETLEKGLALTLQGGYKASNYARSSLSMIDFCCERPALGSLNVRRAIACCFDKDGFIRAITGGYGLRADGLYSPGQWVYQLARGNRGIRPADTAVSDRNRDPDTYGADLEALEALRRYQIPRSAFDVGEAARLLAQDGWTLNEAGEEYDPERDAVRCKSVEGQMQKLALTMACPEDEAVAAAFETALIEPLRQAGVALTLRPMAADALRALCYAQGERACDMIYTEMDFSPVFDPFSALSPDEAKRGGENVTALRDPLLCRLALDLRGTPPGDLALYCQRWVDFQALFAARLPAIPVFSRQVFDFYIGQMQEYRVKDAENWAQAIVGSVIGEISTEDIDGALR